MLVEVLKLAIRCAQPCSGSQGHTGQQVTCLPPRSAGLLGCLLPQQDAGPEGRALPQASSQPPMPAGGQRWLEISSAPSQPLSPLPPSPCLPSIISISPNSWTWGTQVPPNCPHFCLLIHTPRPCLESYIPVFKVQSLVDPGLLSCVLDRQLRLQFPFPEHLPALFH